MSDNIKLGERVPGKTVAIFLSKRQEDMLEEIRGSMLLANTSLYDDAIKQGTPELLDFEVKED